MYYISVQPENKYFIWQLYVQVNNFRKLGVEDKMIIIMGYNKKNGISPEAEELQKKTKARIFFYEDNRANIYKSYIPSIRPFLLKRFFSENQDWIKGQMWMYHDSDILFREVPVIDEKFKYGNVYVSDTSSYLNSKYIKSKSEKLFLEMCEIVRISPRMVEENDSNAGGAQYLFNSNVRAYSRFWDKVMKDSVALYKHMENTKQEYSPEHPIQSWTADMWAVLWNLWLTGYKTEVSPELEFSWPTQGINQWEKTKIFHNAGVSGNDKHLFYRGDFMNKFPFDENFDFVDSKYCSIKYVEEILNTKREFSL